MVSSRSVRGEVFFLYFPDEKLGGELLGGGYGNRTKQRKVHINGLLGVSYWVETSQCSVDSG